MNEKKCSFISMNTIKTLTVFCAVMIVVGMSCSKGDGAAADPGDIHVVNSSDTTYPVLEVYTPAENQGFANGDTIKIDGKVTDNSLYRGTIKITNDASGAVLIEQAYEIHGLGLYSFHLEQKVSVSIITDYTVTVQFEDHGRNISLRSVKIKVNP